MYRVFDVFSKVFMFSAICSRILASSVGKSTTGLCYVLVNAKNNVLWKSFIIPRSQIFMLRLFVTSYRRLSPRDTGYRCDIFAEMVLYVNPLFIHVRFFAPTYTYCAIIWSPRLSWYLPLIFIQNCFTNSWICNLAPISFHFKNVTPLLPQMSG